MKITKEQFSVFSFATQKTLIAGNGIAIISKKIDPLHEARIYIVCDFYMEVIVDLSLGEIIHINPVVLGLSDFYFE